ncbi:MAG: hypothetical protein HQ567_25065 [Candidatus Nealsonbacteria bacterium]|nr:hypothetical protein [Candidatus Nealsonbacteria bacterium]
MSPSTDEQAKTLPIYVGKFARDAPPQPLTSLDPEDICNAVAPWVAKDVVESVADLIARQDERFWDHSCFKGPWLQDCSPFMKVVLKSHHGEVSQIFPQDPGITSFLDEYEYYQRDHRTTLNQALLNSQLVAVGTLTILTARCATADELQSRLAEGVKPYFLLEQDPLQIIGSIQGSGQAALASLSLLIGPDLQQLLFNDTAKKLAVSLRSNEGRKDGSRNAKLELVRTELTRCLEHAHAALMTADNERERQLVLKLALRLLYPDAPKTAYGILLKEALRLIQGILVNLHFASESMSKALLICVLTSENRRAKEDQVSTFASFFEDALPNKSPVFGSRFDEMLCLTYWLHCAHYYGLPEYATPKMSEESIFRLACSSEYGPKILNTLNPSRDKALFCSGSP